MTGLDASKLTGQQRISLDSCKIAATQWVLANRKTALIAQDSLGDFHVLYPGDNLSADWTVTHVVFSQFPKHNPHHAPQARVREVLPGPEPLKR